MAATQYTTIPEGFSIYQPMLGAPLQFFPSLGSVELDNMLNAYLPGPASLKEKRATVSLDFLEYAMATGQTFKFYMVPEQTSSFAASASASPSWASPSVSSLQPSPVASDWDWSSISEREFSSQGSASERSSRKASSSGSGRRTHADFSHMPGMKILTKDGVDVTNSAARGSKTKEQRDHAHLMRIIKACDSCKKKKIRCDPSHKKRGVSSTSSSQGKAPLSAKAQKVARTVPQHRIPAPPTVPTPLPQPGELEIDPTLFPELESFDSALFPELDTFDLEMIQNTDEAWDDLILYPTEEDKILATSQTSIPDGDTVISTPLESFSEGDSIFATSLGSLSEGDDVISTPLQSSSGEDTGLSTPEGSLPEESGIFATSAGSLSSGEDNLLSQSLESQPGEDMIPPASRERVLAGDTVLSVSRDRTPELDRRLSTSEDLVPQGDMLLSPRSDRTSEEDRQLSTLQGGLQVEDTGLSTQRGGLTDGGRSSHLATSRGSLSGEDHILSTTWEASSDEQSLLSTLPERARNRTARGHRRSLCTRNDASQGIAMPGFDLWSMGALSKSGLSTSSLSSGSRHLASYLFRPQVLIPLAACAAMQMFSRG